MGLDTTHGAWHGAYSAFNRFRAAICRATGGTWPDGIDETLYWTFGPGYDSASHPGLYALLSHSDCDGEIDPVTCGKLADELEALLPAIDEKGSGGHMPVIRDAVQRFADGARRAALANETLEFH